MRRSREEWSRVIEPLIRMAVLHAKASDARPAVRLAHEAFERPASEWEGAAAFAAADAFAELAPSAGTAFLAD
jgi:hypothetical protein